MPKNVMKLSKPSPHRARNDFDLSHRHVMSANFGELIPATCIETVPGDHIEIKVADLLRAIPMVTSPFLRAKQHLEAWFVPYRDLWHNFDNFITTRNQPVSSALLGSTFIPHASLDKLYASLDDAGEPYNKDVVGMNIRKTGVRLLNYLGYADSAHPTSEQEYASVNLMRIAAYNYIWYNEYRQQYYDEGLNSMVLGPSMSNASYLFNFDDLRCISEEDALISDVNRLRPMCQMRYRCWKKDLFTGLLPSTQFGNVSTVYGHLDGRLIFQDYDGNSHIIANANAWIKQSNGDKDFELGYMRNNSTFVTPLYLKSNTNPNGGVNSYNQSTFDILALRRSEAVQIWRENALRAGNRTADNMKAHYGVESDFKDHRPTFLGATSSPLNIGDVMTTANSTEGVNNTVGDIAGKGLSSADDYLCKFDAKDFGVIMVMFSILPEAEYNAQGIDRMNQLLEKEDFFTPEYENLGLEAVSSQNFVAKRPSLAHIMGYAPRYYGYKTKLDKCYDVFMTGGINAPWCSPKYDVSQKIVEATTQVMPLSLLYVNPRIFDVNFAVSTPEDVPQFLCDFYFDVDAVRPMSVVGLPFNG